MLFLYLSISVSLRFYRESGKSGVKKGTTQRGTVHSAQNVHRPCKQVLSAERNKKREKERGDTPISDTVDSAWGVVQMHLGREGMGEKRNAKKKKTRFKKAHTPCAWGSDVSWLGSTHGHVGCRGSTRSHTRPTREVSRRKSRSPSRAPRLCLLEPDGMTHSLLASAYLGRIRMIRVIVPRERRMPSPNLRRSSVCCSCSRP